MSWFFPKARPHNQRASDRIPPVAVICRCPNCGNDVLAVFQATEDRISVVENAKIGHMNANSGHGMPRHESNGVVSDEDHAERVLRERKEARERRPLRRNYDPDLQGPSEA